MRTMKRTSLLLLAALAGCGGASLERAGLPTHPEGKVKKAGKGFLLTTIPADEHVAVDEKLVRQHPKVTKDFAQLVKSNTWWGSLIWQYDQKDPYSQNLYAHPLVMRAFKDGLGLSYPDTPKVSAREYMHPYAEDLRVGLSGLAAPDTRVASYSDWAVTAEWSGESALRATIGHGLPFAYFTKTGGAKAVIKATGKVDIWHDGAEAIGITVNGHHYGLFAPSKAKWQKNGEVLESDLGGKDYFSVAVLPSKGDDELERFRKHAYSFVTDTKVSWVYDEAKAKLSATYEFVTKQMDDQKGLATEPIVALYPHLYKYAPDTAFLKYVYASPRGFLKIAETGKFTAEYTFNGILPVLPSVPGADLGSVPRYIKEAANADELFTKGFGPRETRDSYWVGKSFGRNAVLMELADQNGLKAERDRLLVGMENEFTDWFDGQMPRAFYYDEEWRSLLAFPSSYGSADELNDHHFHYGYFIGAAALIAARDAQWQKDFGPFVDIMVKDVANPARDDKRYPFMRHMDAYAGHSWANGPAHFDYGNNQEASSEDTNCSSGIILWGAITGNKQFRDMGIYMLVSQIAAAEQYWFNVDKENFPKGFDNHQAAGMVWGAGAKYDTWFDRDPAMIHGINYLPFTGASLYIGRHPKYVAGAFDEIFKESRGALNAWRDYMMMYLALVDAPRARKMFDADPYFEPEFGNTLANTYDWIAKLDAIGGHVDTNITADAPLYTVFAGSNGGHSYLAYNPSNSKMTVHFSDGQKLDLAPHGYGFAKR